MKTQKLLLALLFALSSSMSWAQITGLTGTGIASDPYLIATPANLITAKTAINAAAGTGAGAAFYKLTANIDMSTTANFYGGIGAYSSPFKGNFDGAGFKISGLTTGGSAITPFLTTNALGFFNYATGASISNLTIDVAYYVSYAATAAGVNGAVCGGLIGSTTTTTTAMLINNCTVTGTIYSESLSNSLGDCRATAGGIIGTPSSAATINIINSTVNASIIAKNSYTIGASCAGGIVGQVWNVTGMTVNIVNCSAAGSVSSICNGSSNAGGIVSIISYSVNPIVNVYNCLATNTISSTGSSTTGYNQLPAAGIGQFANVANMIKNCMALNPSISVVNKTTGALGYALDRINTGTAVSSGNSDLNYAKSDMSTQKTVNGVGPTSLAMTFKAANDKDGADLGASYDAEAKVKLDAYVKVNPSFSGVNLTAWGSDSSVSDSLIAASQGGASPLIFTIPSTDPIITLHSFSDPKEYTVRGGLPNFMNKAKNNAPLKIAYLGGSITQNENRFRNQNARYIQSMFPSASITGINAGVSGTGTNLGCCRLYEHVLKYNPDMVFIEFAVNGGPDAALEGMIRQIWKYNPKIDVCILYSVMATSGLLTGTPMATYRAGGVPSNVASLEVIAAKYNVPSIHMALQPSIMEGAGTLLWKGTTAVTPGQIVFSADGVHPAAPAGGNLYAESIARAFENMKSTTADAAHSIPAAPTDNWEDATMVAPKDICTFSSGFSSIDPTAYSGLSTMAPWFPYIMKASTAGEYLTFSFIGSSFGFFVVGGPDAGQVEVTVDNQNVTLAPILYNPTTMATTFVTGTTVATLNQFNSSCTAYRGQFQMINVPQGTHTVKLGVSAIIPDKKLILGTNLTDINANPTKYDQHVLYFGRILLRGTYTKLITDSKKEITEQDNVKVIGANGHISILGAQSTDSFEIYNVSSKLVMKGIIDNLEQVSVPKGIYIVKYISILNSSKNYKVVVN